MGEISEEERQAVEKQAAPCLSAIDDIAMAGDFLTLELIQRHITNLLTKGAMGAL